MPLAPYPTIWAAVFVALLTLVTLPAYAAPGDQDDPVTGPHELLALDSPDGLYWFDPDGAEGPIAPFQGHYSSDEGGGWLMVLNYVHRGWTNPSVFARDHSVPLLDAVEDLGVDESGTLKWGHASPTVLAPFHITELRFFGITNAHSRRMHFTTTHPASIAYVRTGQGSMEGIEASFVALAGHTTNLPANANGQSTNQGDLALTESPFQSYDWQGGRWVPQHVWAVRGEGKAWAVDWYNEDDYSNRDDYHTIHRVWIRTQAWCGNGVLEVGEDCDDGNTTDTDGCSATCSIEDGFVCRSEPSLCRADECGDGLVGSAETCDDANEVDGDGCDFSCSTENGFECTGEPSTCSSTCGDGRVASNEGCDDGNLDPADGCSPQCRPEHGYFCDDQPSACLSVCGDSLVARDEACDDGNLKAEDGCSAVCAVESGFACGGEPSTCRVCDGDAGSMSAQCDEDPNTRRNNGGDSVGCAVSPRPVPQGLVWLVACMFGILSLRRRNRPDRPRQTG